MNIAKIRRDSRRSTGNAFAWVLQRLLATVFLGTAAAKIAGVSMMIQGFAMIGFGQWFRYVMAVVEIVGALCLLSRRLPGVAALWLGATMLGATMAHILRLHQSPTAPAHIA